MERVIGHFGLASEYHYGAVFVLGPSSSGKTTLCDALAEKLGIRPPQYIKEVARNVMKTHGFTRDNTDTYEMQYAIMAAQLEAEERAATTLQTTIVGSPKVILSDRSAIDPIVYAGTSGVPGALNRRRRLLEDVALQKMLPAYRNSLFVVLEPVTEWLEDDGVRSLEDPERYNSVLFATLRELGIPYVTIGTEMKDICARVDFVFGCLLNVAALSSGARANGD
ncbi:hypothetical protein GY45DRAFT_1245171 [Cubamyces sp. BRFM 1775]|nr:hypothetical protein GY45DRAFT_1245171 [Cubamyces sp. BRFM 1775]